MAYELPTSAPPTDGSGSSSSPGQLIPTPLNADAGPRGGTTGFGLRDWSRSLLPTPMARDWKGENGPNRNTLDLPSQINSLLPTPTASDTNGAGSHGTGGPDLRTVVDELLPTPRATDGTKGGPNQRGSSGDLMLPSAVQQLLPTPTAQDAGGSRNCTQPRKPGMAPATGTTLTDWLWLHEGWTGAPTPPPSTAGSD